MTQHALDLRNAAIRAYATNKGSLRQLAELFGVKKSTLAEWVKRYRATGKSAPEKRGGCRPRTVSEEGQQLIRSLLEEFPNATLEELCEAYENQLGWRVPNYTMCREIKRLNLATRKVDPRRRSSDIKPKNS
jgi:transposase